MLLLLEHNICIRVFHISGFKNTVADRLSRNLLQAARDLRPSLDLEPVEIPYKLLPVNWTPWLNLWLISMLWLHLARPLIVVPCVCIPHILCRFCTPQIYFPFQTVHWRTSLVSFLPKNMLTLLSSHTFLPFLIFRNFYNAMTRPRPFLSKNCSLQFAGLLPNQILDFLSLPVFWIESFVFCLFLACQLMIMCWLLPCTPSPSQHFLEWASLPLNLFHRPTFPCRSMMLLFSHHLLGNHSCRSLYDVSREILIFPPTLL